MTGQCITQNSGLFVNVSQSGETADTLAALRNAKEHGLRTVSIVNAVESSIARDADVVLQIFAGPEISVASTKTFTCQLACLLAVALYAAKKRKVLSASSVAFSVNIANLFEF
jgi:glucosamine--fructose-6-phosphate aminotransferase (isomerizing)